MIRHFCLLFLLSSLWGNEALFHSLDPQSVSESLAYYELYGHQGALERAAHLLGLDPLQTSQLTALINRQNGDPLSIEEIERVEALAYHLPNRKLKGYHLSSEKELLSLTSDEIDLGKALMFTTESASSQEARRYSALLDLMALQILARLDHQATDEEKIEATNHFIFDEMHFRFPPHSLYAKEIDHYTFLSSVVDNHLGVCLGVSALYLAIAQRLDLPLEIITPPGHIYVRYRKGDVKINIETTARGIDVPDEKYLSLNTRALQERTLKEVIGMCYINEASTYLYKEAFERAAAVYEKALPYLPHDPVLKELLGLSYVCIGEEKKGRALLKEIENHTPSFQVRRSNKMAEDYLAGKVDHRGIRALMMHVDETRESIIAKQERLQEVLVDFPLFRDGLLAEAVTYLQLSRTKEALTKLKCYHEVDPCDPVVEYYLAIINGMRNNYPAAWTHLKQAEMITGDFSPKALQELRRTLVSRCPEPKGEEESLEDSKSL